MQSLDCINFVKEDSPNILLIADKANKIQKGYYLKYFKNTHNIYAIFHNLNNNYDFYQDLPSKHNYIKEQLDKNNLKTFTVSALSLGGLLAYYLIFHMPERVERAFIFDYYFNHTDPIQTNLSNWQIKTSSIPIVIYLNKLGFIKAKSIN